MHRHSGPFIKQSNFLAQTLDTHLSTNFPSMLTSAKAEAAINAATTKNFMESISYCFHLSGGGGVRAEFKTLRVLSRKGGSYIDFVPTLAKTLRLFRCAPNPSVLDSTPVHVQCTGVRPGSRVDRCVWVRFHTIRGCYYLVDHNVLV